MQVFGVENSTEISRIQKRFFDNCIKNKTTTKRIKTLGLQITLLITKIIVLSLLLQNITNFEIFISICLNIFLNKINKEKINTRDL